LQSVRRSLRPLSRLPQQYEPPPGLAARTCRSVEAERQRVAAAPALSAAATPGEWAGRWRFSDIATAAAVLLAAAALVVPAIQSSRFNSHVLACQNRLRQIGVALTQYSDRQGGYFPFVPPQEGAASAGIYAPALFSQGLLDDSRQVICPSSALARDEKFRVPTFDEVAKAEDDRTRNLRERMGGSYGYSLGYIHDGVYRGTRNLHRAHFALMSDAPHPRMPQLQSANHSGRGQNVLFEEGHVAFLDTPAAPECPDHFFTNDEGRIAPGTHQDDSVIVSSTADPLLDSAASQ
jgi:hypothetical protein